MNGLAAARAVLARVALRLESEAVGEADYQAHRILAEEIERIDAVLAQAREPDVQRDVAAWPAIRTELLSIGGCADALAGGVPRLVGGREGVESLQVHLPGGRRLANARRALTGERVRGVFARHMPSVWVEVVALPVQGPGVAS